ncbi:hypothetical protein Tco_0714757 [Tanacetum coccineum]
MLSGRATRKAMLENNHCVTSACSTTLACVQEKVEIANGWAIKLDIDISRVIVQSVKILECVNEYTKEKLSELQVS